jgi:hypothetical protein
MQPIQLAYMLSINMDPPTRFCDKSPYLVQRQYKEMYSSNTSILDVQY